MEIVPKWVATMRSPTSNPKVDISVYGTNKTGMDICWGDSADILQEKIYPDTPQHTKYALNEGLYLTTQRALWEVEMFKNTLRILSATVTHST